MTVEIRQIFSTKRCEQIHKADTHLLIYCFVFKMHLAKIEISNLSKCIIRMHNLSHFISVNANSSHYKLDTLESQTSQ